MFYLHHYFNPDFNYRQLSPMDTPGGKVEYRYLSYVQNVVAGQVLAEVVDLEACPEKQCDPRFIYPERYLPCGPNCVVHPENPDKIIAGENGYVFYHNGLISVKKLLNIRGNLGFHTGNIFFIGDLAVHGDVQTDFAVQAKNILVKGHIESAKLKAAHDIICLAGVKGCALSSPDKKSCFLPNSASADFLPSGLLDAGGNIRLPFCENIQLRARGNLIIDGSCLHCTLYVGGTLIVKGRLQGGTAYANKTIYVENQLGSDYSSPTRLMMGYDPFDFLRLQKLESKIKYLVDKLAYLEKLVQRSDVMALEHTPRYELVRRKLQISHARRASLWQKLMVDEEAASECRIIAPGKIMPGCEISIGQTFMRTDFLDSGKIFLLDGGEIIKRSDINMLVPQMT